MMIVDDNEADHYLIKATLDEYDPSLQYMDAYDGVEALALLDKGEIPDVIFLDINMPGMSGFEFLDEYESRTFQKQPVILMLTSSDQEKDKEKVLSYKCTKGYLTKPLDKDDVEQLRSILS